MNGKTLLILCLLALALFLLPAAGYIFPRFVTLPGSPVLFPPGGISVYSRLRRQGSFLFFTIFRPLYSTRNQLSVSFPFILPHPARILLRVYNEESVENAG